MIRGIGVDIVDIDRIGQLLAQYGERFVSKIFTAAETAYCSGRALPAVHYAGRWAVKEAFYKAVPMESQPLCSWRFVQLVQNGNGRGPRLEIVNDTLAGALEKAGISAMHVSLSHERKQCIAVVILE